MVNPPAGLPGDRQQPHRRRRLPAPHHLGMDDRLPRAADRGDAGRAGAPLASPTSSACSTTSSRCRGSRPCTGCRACTPPASARSARSSGSRAGTACCRPGLRRGHDRARLHGRVRAGDRARGGAGPGGGGALDEQVRAARCSRSSPRRGGSRSGCWTLWDEGDPAWFASPQQPEGRSWNEVALEALEKALDGLEERFGDNPDRWRWGRVHTVEFMHPFGAANPLFRRIFNRKVEVGGASETVTQNGYLPTAPFKAVWGPVYRMVADLGDPSRSRWQLTTGQSGHPGSRALRRHDRGLADRAHEPRIPRGARDPRRGRRPLPAAPPRLSGHSAEPPRPDQADARGGGVVPRGRAGAERGQQRARRLAPRDRALVRDAGHRPLDLDLPQVAEGQEPGARRPRDHAGRVGHRVRGADAA